MKNLNNQSFEAFLSKHSVSELINSDLADQQNFDRKQIKKIIKKFWKNKDSAFYREAFFWKLSIGIITTLWYLLFTSGFSLVALANSGIDQYTKHFDVFLGIGLSLVLVGFLINWVYVYWIMQHQATFFQTVLKHNQIHKHKKVICFFIGIGVGTIIATALINAILKETIILIEAEQINQT